MKNACEHGNPYTYKDEPITFGLSLTAEGQKIDLSQRADAKDMFVTFSGENVNLYAGGLTVNHVLEKSRALLTDTCLVLGDLSYCEDETKKLTVSVNGEEKFSAGIYAPKSGDAITISYS